MINKKNKKMYIAVLIGSFMVAVTLSGFKIIDCEKIKNLGTDFYYNMMSLSISVSGFLFAGISILYSLFERPRIERLLQNGYLDNIHRSVKTTVFSSMVAIILSYAALIIKLNEITVMYVIIIISCATIIELIFFAWAMKQVIGIMPKVKE